MTHGPATGPERSADERSDATATDGDDHRHEVLDPKGPCMACGSPNARIYGSPDGPARLCPPCAALNGLGCP